MPCAQPETDVMSDRSPHLDGDEARTVLAHLKSAKNEERRALMAQLAWRPAWAIRSRKGA